MKKETIARTNAAFFVVAVGMALGIKLFAEAVLDSSRGQSEFPTDCATGKIGYIRIDSSSIRKEGGESLWCEFVGKVKAGLLGRASYEFGSDTEFNGDFAEKVTFERDGYVFSFHIRQYERDIEHGFEIINPEDLENIPEDEELGKVVYLTIAKSKEN